MNSFEKTDHKRDWNRLGSEKEEDTSKQILLRGGDSVEATDENTDGEEEGNEDGEEQADRARAPLTCNAHCCPCHVKPIALN